MTNITWLLRMSTPSLGTGPDPAWIQRAHPYGKNGASPGLSEDPTFTPSVVNKMIKVPRRDTHSSVSQTAIQKVANSNTKTAKTWQKRYKLRYKNSKNRANRYTKM